MLAMIRHLLAATLLLGGLMAAPGAARAAESYDNCSGFIDSLPATITTQGVWCLRHDLGTNITTGNAITIAANNVGIDCNDFKLGGLAAGNSTQANGIYALGRQNVTLRHCSIRGFYRGIYLDGGAGHLVEDNRLDNNLFVGIVVAGVNSLVQRNRVFDTGGAPDRNISGGISTAGDVIDNIVDGVFAAGTDSSAEGIQANGAGIEIRGNQVRGLAITGIGYAVAIDTFSGSSATIDGNRISAETPIQGVGIYGAGDPFCSHNTVAGFATPMAACQDAGGNASH